MAPSIQPRHRRPSWRQSRVSHRTYLEADFGRKESHDLPADGDTFCYNHAFIAEWTMPADLWIRLPSPLTSELRNWQAAGAAMCTALARIDKLDEESLHRGWPSRNNTHLSRAMSSSSSVIESPRSSSIGSPEPTPTTAPAGLSPLQTNCGINGTMEPLSQTQTDTPPFTPQDSVMGDAFDHSGKPTNERVGPDHFQDFLANRTFCSSDHAGSSAVRSPSGTPSSRRESANTADPSQPLFDEAAWDVFIRSYEAELEHLRTETLVRFRHMGRSIDRLWLNLKSDTARPMLHVATIEFVGWWQKMTDKSQEYEKEIQVLDPPQLGVVRVNRVAQGLPT